MPTTTRRSRSGASRRSSPNVARRAAKRRTVMTPTRSPVSLAARLRAAAGPITFREVGAKTDTHPENARRYLQGGSVSVNFLRNFCRAFNVSADWLLEGKGQMNRKGR